MIRVWAVMMVLMGDQNGIPPPIWRATQEECRAALIDAMEEMHAKDRALRSILCVEVDIPFAAAAIMGIIK